MIDRYTSAQILCKINCATGNCMKKSWKHLKQNKFVKCNSRGNFCTLDLFIWKKFFLTKHDHKRFCQLWKYYSHGCDLFWGKKETLQKVICIWRKEFLFPVSSFCTRYLRIKTTAPNSANNNRKNFSISTFDWTINLLVCSLKCEFCHQFLEYKNRWTFFNQGRNCQKWDVTKFAKSGIIDNFDNDNLYVDVENIIKHQCSFSHPVSRNLSPPVSDL